jgi:hypothetical protein
VSVRVWLRGHEDGNNGHLSRDQSIEEIYGFLAPTNTDAPIEGYLASERPFIRPFERIQKNTAWDVVAGSADDAEIIDWPNVPTAPAWSITEGDGGSTIDTFPGQGESGALAITVPLTTYTLDGLTLDLRRALLADVPAATYALTGETPTTRRALRAETPATDYGLTLPVPVVSGAAQIEVPATSYALSDFAPTLDLFAAPVVQGPIQGGWGHQDLESADRVARKADEDRKRDREERKAAVLRAFDALDPKPVAVPTKATVERIAVRALDDLGIDRAAAELRRLEAMVRDLWKQRLAEIEEDEAIALLLLAA